jgi:GNAT superfamily N-acetyltransferase
MLRIHRTTSEDPEFLKLVELLNRELWIRYPAEQAQYDQHNKVDHNKTVVIAYIGNEAVGCGCIKPVDLFTVEVKRMFVLPPHRGKGIAVALLTELEIWARELSFKKAILETGVKQPEAIAVYKKTGYFLIENYEPYIGMPSSICMGKSLV